MTENLFIFVYKSTSFNKIILSNSNNDGRCICDQNIWTFVPVFPLSIWKFICSS